MAWRASLEASVLLAGCLPEAGSVNAKICSASSAIDCSATAQPQSLQASLREERLLQLRGQLHALRQARRLLLPPFRKLEVLCGLSEDDHAVAHFKVSKLSVDIERYQLRVRGVVHVEQREEAPELSLQLHDAVHRESLGPDRTAVLHDRPRTHFNRGVLIDDVLVEVKDGPARADYEFE